jgi:DNA (cytosine-5)-methyltransferase 1
MTGNDKLTAYALFAGAGGMHLGLESAGIRIAVASDVSPAAERTHFANRPKIPFIREDIRKLTGERLLITADGKRPDIIAGGPPCQGFSTLGDKISGDPRNQLFQEFVRVVSELKPNFLLMENVKSLTTMYQGQFKDYIVQSLEAEGYRVFWSILDAADYGAPQHRQRVIFFGTRHNAPFEFPRPTHGPNAKKPYVTVRQAISDLERMGSEIANHCALNHSARVIERYKLIPEGGRLPPPEQLPKHIRRGNFGNTYKRLHRDRPSLTMVPGNNAFPIHPTLNRSLTPREAARLQTFSDDIVFVGDRRNQCILVGNAVPPVLARALGKSVIRHVNQKGAKDRSRNEIRREAPKSAPSAANDAPKIRVGKNNTDHGFIDLFCGAGGITIGMEKAGWRPLLGVDWNKFAASTHRLNFPAVPHLTLDLSNEGALGEVSRHVHTSEVGVICGGPPCQGFSMFGKRRFVNTRGYDPRGDDRNRLVFAFVEAVREIQPRWFVMENVPGLVNLDGGIFLKALLKEFKKAGFCNVEARILNAADYGVPQLRRRLLIIGNRTGHIIPWPKKKFFAAPKEWQDAYRTVDEVISDLSSEQSEKRYSCHVPMRHKPLLVERYKYIPEGGRLDVSALPAHLKVGYRTAEVKNYSHVFKRLHREKPSITMVPGHNAFPIHPWLNRALTVREAARIQTFPDSVQFLGSRQEQCIQVGNAFPPLLAEVIGNNIRKAEKNDWYPGRVPRSAYYALVEQQESPISLFSDEADDGEVAP